jgi:hypothetical protein
MMWETSPLEFVIVTGVIGGGAAGLAGRAVANAWRPWWVAALWMLPLATGVRFLHFALFQATLLSPRFYLLDLAVLLVLALAGHRWARRRQITTRYAWLFCTASPFGWRPRPQDRPDANLSPPGGRDARS